MVDDGKKIGDDSTNNVKEHTVVLSNRSQFDIYIAENGIEFESGQHFRIKSIVDSSKSAEVSNSNSSIKLSANNGNTVTLTVLFDPSGSIGTLSDSFTIQTLYTYTDGITYNYGDLRINLSGTSTPQAQLSVTAPSGDASDPKLEFTETAFDVSKTSTRTFTITNPGSGAMTINANGITVPAGSGFTISSIVSSTQGNITSSLKTVAKTIAAYGAETWTVTAVFTPTESKYYQNSLTISYIDKNISGSTTKTKTVSLLGYGKTAGTIVFDAETVPVNKTVTFENVHADGADGELSVKSIQFFNPGEIPLVVDKNGIVLTNGSQYKIRSITSSTFGTVDLSLGAATIKANDEEVWTVELVFDPTSSGGQTDTLSIKTNSAKGSPVTVSLTGTGLNQPELRLKMDDTDVPSTVILSDTLADGTGGNTTTRQFVLTNPGTQTLTVNANGISFNSDSVFKVKSVVSSTQGDITSSLNSSTKTIAAQSAETWTATVEFDPVAIGDFTDTLKFSTNDSTSTTRTVTFKGKAVLPTIAITGLTVQVNVFTKDTYSITWNDAYTGGDADISFYYDTDQNSTNGMTEIVNGIHEDGASNRYFWQVPETLAGKTV